MGPGSTVLVHGANGGVGSTLVQLARNAGARVIGTAAPRHADAVRALGAEPVDRTDPELPSQIRELAPSGVDAVFDHVGGPGLLDSWRLLAPGGTLASYGTAAAKVEPGASRLPFLRLLGRPLADGTLTAHVAARVPLPDAAAAMRLAESHTVLGKVVLVPAAGTG